MTPDEIEREIKRILFKHLSPKEYKIFVYGSRATGRARQWSDWDIGIMSGHPVDSIALMNAEEELEESLDIPYNIKLVDFANVSPKFKEVALVKIIPWTTSTA